jgi:capsular polysaccharide export protein
MPDRRRSAGASALTFPRSFLFFQGPQSYFFERVARALSAQGHRVHRINLNLGDRMFWRLPASDFRGRFEAWPGFVGNALERRRITDIVLLGGSRPYHVAAIEAARERGVAVHVTDLGYVRPGWLTLEPDGSHFPRDPGAIRTLAAQFPAPDLAPGFATPFRLLAAHDIAYTIATSLGRPLYAHYRRHGLYHPFAEYAGWIGNAPRRLATRHATAAAKARLAATPGGYFLYPLQLATDFQLRVRSPFADAREALRTVLRSFAESRSARRLAVVGHPLDEGLIDWHRLIRQHGDDRVLFFHGGIPDELLANAAGMVTVNSTTGLGALRKGVPVKTLGRAIYDVAGLTHTGHLAGFWCDPLPPDPDLMAAFLRALIGTAQIKGGYYTLAEQAQALPAFVERLENGGMLSCAGNTNVG